jgi:RNA polymerase sigma-70 factor (ECF subfamily)
VGQETVPEIDSEELVSRARDGDESAWRALFARDREMIFRVAYRICLDREEALDAVQETFSRAFQSIHQLQGDAGWGAWLRTIGVNTAISRVRRKGSVIRSLGWPVTGEEAERISDSGGDPREKTEESLMGAALQEALQRLSPQQRAVATLYFEDDLSGPEIGAILGLRAGTVRVHLFRAKRQIVRQLERFRPEGERR